MLGSGHEGYAREGAAGYMPAREGEAEGFDRVDAYWLPWPSGTDSVCDTEVAYCVGGNRWGRPDPDDECDPLLGPKRELTEGQWAWLHSRDAFDLYVVREGVPVACVASMHGGRYQQRCVWFAWCVERQFLRGDVALMREYRGAA